MPSARTTATLLLTSVTVMLAAGCSGGGDTTAAGATPGGQGRGQQFTAYVDCMKQNGVPLTLPSFGPRPGASGRPQGTGYPSGMPRPDRSGGPRRGGGFLEKPAGVDDATWQKAQAACATLRPSGRPGGGNGAAGAYRNCLRQHGVTLGGNANTADPAVAKALEACKVLRPSAAPSPSA
ncbi:hypothetical protein [Krasilnikovia sp. MM14-A1259]|uniref:hypothetical protein n=1 Tax=Krasilnikovia sp. MM14-A1259 TaxID=3373539 RepID=UPI0038247166